MERPGVVQVKRNAKGYMASGLLPDTRMQYARTARNDQEQQRTNPTRKHGGL